MEHEVYVPFPVGSVRAALAEPERVVRCVPGLQLDAAAEQDSERDAERDAGSGPFHGRLRVRIGGHTITYRGTLSLTERENGFAVAAEGNEARGSGSVKLTLTVVPRPSADREDGTGTVLVCTGTVRGEGRIAEYEDKQTAAAGRRLLDRFGAAFAESLAADTPADDNERVIPGIPAPEAPEEPPTSVFETEVPPPSLEPESPEGTEGAEGPSGTGADSDSDSDSDSGAEPREPAAAEAAHARRTMIGRSAEEVDHAPPRGRYAPVPAPETVSPTATLRWAAPAAALALAGAVVLSRMLRRKGR